MMFLCEGESYSRCLHVCSAPKLWVSENEPIETLDYHFDGGKPWMKQRRYHKSDPTLMIQGY
jgi:hypothetical protein